MKSISLLFVFLMLSMLPWVSYATKHKDFLFQDQNWTLYTTEKRSLLVLGPWGDDPTFIDRYVSQFWGSPNSFGMVIVYRKEDDLSWSIVQHSTGRILTGGALVSTNADIGFIDWVAMSPTEDGATIKVSLDSGKYMVYKVNIHGLRRLIREGTIVKP